MPSSPWATSAWRERLLAARTPAGHWEGELSSSSLATATAVSALSLVGGHEALVRVVPPRVVAARVGGRRQRRIVDNEQDITTAADLAVGWQ